MPLPFLVALMTGHGGHIPDDLSEADALQVAWLIRRYVDQQRMAGGSVSRGLLTMLTAVATRAMQGHPVSEIGQHPRRREAAPMSALLLTYEQAADLLGYSLSTVKRRVAAGQLVPVRDGGCARLRRTDVEAFIESNQGA